ncbi:MAG: methyl-accepting chemotaxis protein [Spirochaetota bacterium]|nr:methyl-accepting chemotaxis protein [Spirochaetota bacterium]
MFKNMKVVTKLIVMLILPILGLLYFSVNGITDKFEITKEMDTLSELVNFSIKISNFVHESQKERGRTAIYFGYKGKSDEAQAKSNLDKQKIDTNKKISNLKEHYMKIKNFINKLSTTEHGKQFVRLTNTAFNKLNKLNNIRESVNQSNISLQKAINYYTETNKSFLLIVEDLADISDNAKIAIKATGYANFLFSKEKAGIERAVLANTFANNRFEKEMFIKFSSLVAEQKLYIDMFLLMANEDVKNIYMSKMKDNVINEVDKMRQIAFEKANEGNFNIDSSFWFDKITTKINILKDIEDKLSANLQNEATQSKNKAQTDFLIYLIVTGVVIIISVYLITIITRGISNQLGGEPNVIANIAEKVAEGNLTLSFSNNGHKVTGVYAAMRNMVENLKKIIHEISEVSSNLSASSEELNASAMNLSDGAQTQAASVEETSASTEELTSSIKQVSDHANTMQDKSNQSLNDAKVYKQSLNKVSEEMLNISSSTEKIGDIIRVINDIADQTNLLSLNAAIEAARAGEHGKGFAVVAEAISTLANRSAESTKQIEKLIADSVTRINQGVASVKNSSESFNSIIKAIEDNNNIVNDISASMGEQHKGSEQIQKATEEINNQTQNVSASAEQMAGSTSELHNLAERLNQIVQTFVISGNGNHSKKLVLY